MFAWEHILKTNIKIPVNHSIRNTSVIAARAEMKISN